jgi:hypothetical protein
VEFVGMDFVAAGVTVSYVPMVAGGADVGVERGQGLAAQKVSDVEVGVVT